MMFINNAELVYAIFIGMLVANFFVLTLGLMCARIFPLLLNVPKAALLATVTLLCVIGSFAMGNSIFTVGIMFVSGIAGFFLREMGINPGPIILGLILGPIAEANYRSAMELSRGSLAIFVEKPVSIILVCLILALLSWPLVRAFLERRKKRRAAVA
jgi:putative tricarboxylic transport membrane protein